MASPPRFETVLCEQDDHVALVTLNRPERRNALGAQMKQDVMAAFAWASESSEVRAVVLTGAGEVFCAGGDVKEMRASQAAGAARSLEEKIRPSRDLALLAVHECAKPVIAAIQGAAVGSGMNLALAADMRLASRSASFCQAFVKRGLPPDTGSTYFLPRIVGLARACELAMTGDVLDAAAALRLGIVSQVEEPDALLPAALALAHRIAAGPPVAIRLAKRALYLGQSSSLREALAREAAALNICLDTDDAKEGVQSFLERRAPRFRGI